MATSNTNRVLLYIAIGVGVILLLSCIGLVVAARNFMQGDFGQNLGRMMSTTSRVQAIIPDLISGFESYISEHDEYPESIADLAEHVTGENTISEAEDLFTYTKPSEEAPGSFVMLTTENVNLTAGGETSAIRVEVTKDLNAHQVTVQPLGSASSVSFGP